MTDIALSARNAVAASFHTTFSQDELTQHVNAAFKNYHSVLTLSRSPLANSPLVTPALVLDNVSPTADARGRALRLVLQWAVERLAPGPVPHPPGTHRPFDDSTWRDPHWWRYNILRHRYLEPLHPDQFVEGGRFTETLIALTGIPSTDTFFDERNRAIRDVAHGLHQQLKSGHADEELQRLALTAAYRPLHHRPAAQKLLGIAATFDDVFPRALLLRMAVAEQIDHPDAALDYLTAHRFLLTGDEGRNLWLSPILQAYVYHRQPKAVLLRRHQQVARYYREQEEPLKCVEHLQRAEQWSQAATLLLAAAADLINELQLDELIRALRLFSAQQLPAAQWCELQILLSDLYTRRGQPDAAISACRQALQVAEEPVQQARIYRRMGKLYEERNPLHALGYYEQAAAHFSPSDLELLDLLKDRAWLYIFRQEWQKAETDLTFALAHAPSTAHAARADIYDALASLHRYQAAYDTAIRYAQQALALREESGDLLRVGHSFGNLGLLYNAMGEYRHAIAAYEEALSIFHKQGNAKSIATARLNLGMAHHFDGRLAIAVEQYTECLRICREINAPLIESKAHSNLVEAYMELEQPEAAQRHWQRGHDVSSRAGFDDEVAYFLQLRDRWSVLQTEPAPARSTAGERPAATPDVALDPDDLQALRIAERSGRLTPRALMDEASISKATATRRLAGLVQRGYLTKHGKGRGTYYTLSDDAPQFVQRQRNDPAAASATQSDLHQTLAHQRLYLAERFAVDALGIVTHSPSAAPGSLSGCVDLVARFSSQPTVRTFFELEQRLCELLGTRVDLRPVDGARHGPAESAIAWVW